MDTLRDEVLDRLEGKRGLHLPTPFGLLNSALGGGMVPGEVTVVGGWTSHAKSVLVMQTADNLVEKGGDAIYLTNEMRRDEVALRVMANHGGPPFPQLRAGQVTVDQWQKVFRAVSKLTLKIIDATMRRVEEVCAFIASRRPDLAVIDLFNRLPRSGGGTQELDDQVSRICDCAARSNTHVMLVSQLNRARLSSSKDYPHPNLGDLRDTGSLATHPANVIFTYLAEEEGIREGYVEVAKARGGRVGDSVPVVLNPVTMRLIQTQLL
jgi:replicative DNA helicase